MRTEEPVCSQPITVSQIDASRYSEVVPFAGLLEDDPLDAATLVDRDRRGASVNVHLAAERVGQVVGYAHVERFKYAKPGEFSLGVATSPRGEGIGSRLLAEAESIAAGLGALVFHASIRDNDEATRAFVERRRYTVAYHTFSSEMDLTSFDLPPIELEGIAIESFAETDRSESAMRRLFDINERGSNLVPDQGRPFDQFRKDVFEASWFRAKGQIMAVVDGQYVGIAAVGEVAPGHFYHMNTAVHPHFRGRGIATALKLRAIHAAKAMGGKIVTTHNDSNNAPMLAINRRLGYVPRPGRYGLRKELI